MPRRTVTVTMIEYHDRYKVDAVKEVAKLPDGTDLLHLFHAFLKATPRDQLVNYDHERYVSLGASIATGRTLLARTAIGRFGEAGENRNIATHQLVHTHGADESPMVDTRSLLVVPPRGSAALLFIERAGGIGGGSELLRLFQIAWKRRYPYWTLKMQTIVETEAWLAAANLEAVTAVQYGWNADMADTGLPRVVGDLRHTLEPPRGQRYLPRKLLEALRDRKVGRGKLLGFAGDGEPDEVSVKVSSEGKTKTFVLGRERRPAVSYQLSDVGEPIPGVDAFRTFCLGKAPDLLAPVGVAWQASWNTGSWSPEELSVVMEEVLVE